jgi:hypothetical protein
MCAKDTTIAKPHQMHVLDMVHAKARVLLPYRQNLARTWVEKFKAEARV